MGRHPYDPEAAFICDRPAADVLGSAGVARRPEQPRPVLARERRLPTLHRRHSPAPFTRDG
jgi:hypothetical protein